VARGLTWGWVELEEVTCRSGEANEDGRSYQLDEVAEGAPRKGGKSIEVDLGLPVRVACHVEPRPLTDI